MTQLGCADTNDDQFDKQVCCGHVLSLRLSARRANDTYGPLQALNNGSELALWPCTACRLIVADGGSYTVTHRPQNVPATTAPCSLLMPFPTIGRRD